jgi:hypothetical protein
MFRSRASGGSAGVIVDSTTLFEKAAQCRRLANGATDDQMRAKLLALAEEFEVRAERAVKGKEEPT